MPERVNPRIHHGSGTFGQARDELVELVDFDHFAARPLREPFERLAVGLERAELLGGRLGGPTELGARKLAPIRRRDFGAGEVSALLARRVVGFVNAGFLRARDSGQLDAGTVRTVCFEAAVEYKPDDESNRVTIVAF